MNSLRQSCVALCHELSLLLERNSAGNRCPFSQSGTDVLTGHKWVGDNPVCLSFALMWNLHLVSGELGRRGFLIYYTWVRAAALWIGDWGRKCWFFTLSLPKIDFLRCGNWRWDTPWSDLPIVTQGARLGEEKKMSTFLLVFPHWIGVSGAVSIILGLVGVLYFKCSRLLM